MSRTDKPPSVRSVCSSWKTFIADPGDPCTRAKCIRVLRWGG
jgi:hypothetical protein